MVADPFHLLECAMTAEGGAAVVLTRADRAADLAQSPVFVLGGGTDYYGPAYQHPPVWELGGNTRPDLVAGNVGRRAAEEAFACAGLGPGDVDVCEFYDPFSFEIIRQFEAYGFCGPGEGGDYVTSGAIEPGGATPVTTDGGTMSFSHGGAAVQLLQRVIRGVEQLRGECASMQVEGAEVAMCTGGGCRCAVHRRGPAREGTTVTLLRPQAGEIPLPHPGAVSAPYWEGCAVGGAAVPALRPLRRGHPHPGDHVRPLHRHRPVLGGQQRPRRGVQLDHGVAAVDPRLRGALRAGDRGHGGGLAHAGRPRRVRARRRCASGCPVEVEFFPHPGGVTLPYFHPGV